MILTLAIIFKIDCDLEFYDFKILLEGNWLEINLKSNYKYKKKDVSYLLKLIV